MGSRQRPSEGLGRMVSAAGPARIGYSPPPTNTNTGFEERGDTWKLVQKNKPESPQESSDKKVQGREYRSLEVLNL